MTVAVIGGTGTAGPFVVSSLLARGADVRVLARDADRARPILGHQPEIRQADIGDHDQVIAACAGAESVLGRAHHKQMNHQLIVAAATHKRTRSAATAPSGPAPGPGWTARSRWPSSGGPLPVKWHRRSA